MAGEEGKQTFEEYLKKLQEILKKLEQEEMPLEESLHYFQEGLQLSQKCQEILDRVECQVEVLLQEKGKKVPFRTE